jgi:hypothetical protein
VEVRALGANGESLAIDATPETDRSSARYSFAAPPSGMATVRYRVALAGRHGNANTGFEFRRKLVVDERFALLRGRDLFLFPDRPETVGGVSIFYALPTGWRAWSSWMPQGSGGAPVKQQGRRALEEMLSGPLALGAFEPHRLHLAGTEYRFLIESGIPESARDELKRDLETATRAVAGWFDRSLDPEYVAFVLPRSASGDEIAGDASGTGQGATLYPLTIERLRGFTRRLLDAHLQYPPLPLPFRDPSDRWFALGLRELLSVEIVAGVRGFPTEIVDKYLAHEYAILPAGQPQLLDMERAFTDPRASEGTKQSVMAAVAPLAVRALERKVGGPTPSASGSAGRPARIPSARSGASSPSRRPTAFVCEPLGLAGKSSCLSNSPRRFRKSRQRRRRPSCRRNPSRGHSAWPSPLKRSAISRTAVAR